MAAGVDRGVPAGLSEYLKQAAARVGATTPVVLAVDTADMFDPGRLKAGLGKADAPKGKALAADAPVRLFAGLKGVTLAVRATDKRTGELRLDYARTAAPARRRRQAAGPGGPGPHGGGGGRDERVGVRGQGGGGDARRPAHPGRGRPVGRPAARPGRRGVRTRTGRTPWPRRCSRTSRRSRSCPTRPGTRSPPRHLAAGMHSPFRRPPAEAVLREAAAYGEACGRTSGGASVTGGVGTGSLMQEYATT